MAEVTIGTVLSIGSAFVFSVIIERMIDKIRITTRWMIGAILGFIGIILLCMAKNSGIQINHEYISFSVMISGVVLGLLAGFTYALYSWIARRIMQKHIASKAVMGTIFGLGGLLLLLILILTGKPFLDSWINMEVGIYMILVFMFLGYICFGYGLAYVQSSVAITITLLESVVAAILAVIIVKERISFLS